MYSKPPISKETKEYLIKKLKNMRDTARKQSKFSKKNNWIEFYIKKVKEIKMEDENDLFDLTKEEYCKKYNVDEWVYELRHKKIQEM